MKKLIQPIRILTVTSVKIAAIAAVMSFAVPASSGTSAASAQAWDFPRVEYRIGVLKLCLLYCFFDGYCCEVEGLL